MAIRPAPAAGCLPKSVTLSSRGLFPGPIGAGHGHAPLRVAFRPATRAAYFLSVSEVRLTEWAKRGEGQSLTPFERIGRMGPGNKPRDDIVNGATVSAPRPRCVSQIESFRRGKTVCGFRALDSWLPRPAIDTGGLPYISLPRRTAGRDRRPVRSLSVRRAARVGAPEVRSCPAASPNRGPASNGPTR